MVKNVYYSKIANIYDQTRWLTEPVAEDVADFILNLVLTVHMLHTVTSVRTFLDEINRVLTPKGFYLNAQWITPPARLEFERHLRAILSKYEEPQPTQKTRKVVDDINVEEYLRHKGYQCDYVIAKEWTVSNTVQELLSFYRSRAYGLCWLVADEAFHLAMEEFEEFCQNHYGSLEAEVSSQAKFEIWAYSSSQSDPESSEV